MLWLRQNQLNESEVFFWFGVFHYSFDHAEILQFGPIEVCDSAYKCEELRIELDVEAFDILELRVIVQNNLEHRPTNLKTVDFDDFNLLEQVN